MSWPWMELTLSSAVGSYALVNHFPELWFTSRPTYPGTFALLLAGQFVIWAVYRVLLYPKYFSPLRHLPGPSGNSWWNGQFGRISREPSGHPMREWANTIPNNGLIRYMGLFNSERIFVTSPKGLSEVLTIKSYDFEKPSLVRAGIGRLLGFGVVLAEGDEHRIQRKNLMPAFAFRHVKDLYPIFWTKSRQVIAAMTGHIKGGGLSQEEMGEIVKNPELAEGEAVIEVSEWASRVTLDIIGVAGMGKDFNAIAEPDNRLYVTYRTVFRPSAQASLLGLLNLFLPPVLVRNLPVKRNGEIEQGAATIRDEARKLIRSKKEKKAKGLANDVDILSVALESGVFTDEALVDQLMTFLAAGHETTATAVTWSIYMLCLYPEVQTRLRKEVREHLPSPEDDEASITSQDIDSLPYLNAVCSEVLRYYPPIPMTFRDAAVNTSILGQRIPKGTRIILAPWATNRQQDLWSEDASKFDPERWLNSDGRANSDGGAKSNYANMTFLHGPRSCIGQGMARGEYATLLACWVGRFEFRLNDEREKDEDEVEIKGGVGAKPAKGIYVRIKAVDGW